MAYILNLVLGCWITCDDNKTINSGFLRQNAAYNSLNDLVMHWNDHPNNWVDIHYPCREEHFQIYLVLPDDVKSLE